MWLGDIIIIFFVLVMFGILIGGIWENTEITKDEYKSCKELKDIILGKSDDKSTHIKSVHFIYINECTGIMDEVLKKNKE